MEDAEGSSKEKLQVIYSDEYIAVINKPHGLPVHRSKYVKDAKIFALQELRNQIGRHVLPCHRLDRKTSGILVFAFSPEIKAAIDKQFVNNEVSKTYRAIVRGYTKDDGIIDYPLISDKGKLQEAVTHYQTLSRVDYPMPFGKFDTSRYSLVEVSPKHGRFHQIRKHFAHISHPIIGDGTHGCNKQNRLFKSKWGITTMFLHAQKLSMCHPAGGKRIEFTAECSPEFVEAERLLGL